MDTPHSSTHRRPLRALCALGLTLAAMAACAGSAGAYVSPAQAEHAALIAAPTGSRPTRKPAATSVPTGG